MRARKDLLIITERGKRIGIGHYTRSLNLRRILQTYYDVQLSCLEQEENSLLIEQVSPAVFYANENVLHQDMLEAAARSECHCIIIDWSSYEDYRRQLITSLPLPKVIFGLSPENLFGDIVVNVAEGGAPKSKVSQVDGITLFTGPRYVFLKPEILAIRGKYMHRNLQTVLLVFGGTDPSGLLFKSLQYLVSAHWLIRAIISPLHSDYWQVKGLADKETNIHLHTGFEDIAQFIQTGEVLVTAPGNLMLEGICYGVPTLCFCQNAKQTADFQEYPNVYPAASLENIKDLISTIHTEYLAWRKFCHQISVGTGVLEVIKTVRNLSLH